MPPRATWGITRTSQEAEGVRDKCEQEPLLWLPWERKSRVSGLGLASPNNFRGFWDIGVASSCLVPGSG